MQLTEKIAKILVVDDEPDMRQLMVHFIEMIGYSSVTCGDGAEALGYLETNKVDIVLSDLRMPRLDGLGLLEKLNERGWQNPFIMLTGFGSQESARQALRLGAYDFVEKPFDRNHLTSILHGAVRLSHEISVHEASDKSELILQKAKHIDFASIIQQCDPSATARQQFIDHSLDTLTFCKASVKNLTEEGARKIELGYLFRVMRDFTQQAQHCGFFDLSAFAAMVTECLIYYRSRPDKLRTGEIMLFSEVIYFLVKYLKVVDNQKSMQYLFFRLAEKMDALSHSFSGSGQSARPKVDHAG